jgi:hypothetical protein
MRTIEAIQVQDGRGLLYSIMKGSVMSSKDVVTRDLGLKSAEFHGLVAADRNWCRMRTVSSQPELCRQSD